MIHKTTRSILSVLLAALLLVTSIPLTPAFADGGGVSPQSESAEGRALEPADDGVYQIGTAEELRAFAEKVNDGETTANAVLTADIDLNPGFTFKEDGSYSGPDGEKPHQWIPIGNEDHLYTGTFNGAGHTISGLYIDSNADCQGLFGYVSGSGKIEKLSVSGTVSGGMYVGGVVRLNNGSVEDCDFTGSVSGSYVGGVVGVNGGNVINCTNTGTVTGTRTDDDVSYGGGVVGYNPSSVTNCYNTGTVTGPESGNNNRVGGVVGRNDGSVKNCYNTGTGTVTGSGNSVGGVVGYNSGSSTVENCYNTGKVSDGTTSGGVVGQNSGSVTNCYFLTGTAASGIGNKEDAEGATAVSDLNDQMQFKGWDFDNTWRISKSLNRPVLQDNAQDGLPPGLGTDKSPYEISTADQLENFRDLVNGANNQTADPDAHAKLMNDINLNGNATNQWIPIGNSIGKSYEGTFNGDGHTISGLYIGTTANNQGLFGYLSTDGGNTGTVKDLSVSGTVSGNRYVGGVVGYNNGGIVTGCTFSGSGSGTGVTGSEDVGGVVGRNDGTVENCYNTGAVSGSGWYVGGIVGQNRGTVENCYNTGSVSGSDYVGGVVGYNVDFDGYSASVENCYNTGSVTVTGSDGRVGGVVGQNYNGTVENCYNTGSVTVTGSDGRVGGVVGQNFNGSITNCYYQIDKGATVGIGNETTADTSKAEGKTDAQFASGEVAYLLQSKQTTPVWGQNIGEDKSPVLTSDQEKKRV